MLWFNGSNNKQEVYKRYIRFHNLKIAFMKAHEFVNKKSVNI